MARQRNIPQQEDEEELTGARERAKQMPAASAVARRCWNCDAAARRLALRLAGVASGVEERFPCSGAVCGGGALGVGGARKKKEMNARGGDLPRSHLFMVKG